MSPSEGTRRVALITGASRGIGQAIAIGLAPSCDVVLVAREKLGLSETVSRCQDHGAAHLLTCDVGNTGQVTKLADRARDVANREVTIFVHAAGIAPSARIADITVTHWRAAMDVNVTAALLIAQGCLPWMSAAGWGRVITVGSIYSRMSARFAGSYAASKHALLGLTRTIAMEYASKGITANVVVPGWTDTAMVREEAEKVAAANGVSVDEALRRFLKNQPLGRMIRPLEVAALVRFLCSDSAGGITGQALNIDGGSMQA